MWRVTVEKVPNRSIHKFKIFARQKQITYRETIKLWQENPHFCSFFNSLIADSDFAALFWETPPITIYSLDRPFEFVLVNSPRLQKVNSNPRPFKKYFTSTSGDRKIVAFDNLGKDATLVVPLPVKENTVYTHLANFVRYASSSQQIALWQKVGQVALKAINKQPIWISTSGLGVYWLHIRIDSYPKYYSFQPYKEISY